ncbi:unnamed protein product [Ambrosiozyma monospora]|uniref:Unnamed protein product n=1 Tax=Ambrosiozyma monospora TaxID=43982 RepID=A0A9W6Z3P9_AMBMO|nr:unnamed protein product [Ambrosiozyma monospora]
MPESKFEATSEMETQLNISEHFIESTPIEKSFAQQAMTEIIVGSISGAIGKIVEFPFDSIKVKLQYSQSLPTPIFTSTWHCIKSTWINEGWYNGFYKGLMSPMIGSSLEIASLFVSYKMAQDGLNYLKGRDSKYELTMPEKFLCGGVSGISASFVLTPVELIKVKYQVENLKQLSPAQKLQQQQQSTSISKLVKSIYQAEGIKGLWKGQTTTLVREFGSSAAWFGAYEMTLEFFKSRNQKSVHLDLAKLQHNNKEDYDHRPLELLIAGGMAGMAYNGILFPVDTVKSIIQSQDHLTGSNGSVNSSNTVLGVSKMIYLKHGLKGFYSGLGITMIKTVPASGIMFYSYETSKKQFF